MSKWWKVYVVARTYDEAKRKAEGGSGPGSAHCTIRAASVARNLAQRMEPAGADQDWQTFTVKLPAK